MILNVGSSCASLWSALLSFSRSGFVFGAMATERMGSGKAMASRMIGAASDERVSPVSVFRSPTVAAISPARTSYTSSRLLACIRRSRPTRSRTPLVVFSTWSPTRSEPE